MRSIELFSIAIVVLCVCLLSPACAEKSDNEQGIVYGYGGKLSPPYQFTNIGGDTLYLNALPFYPIRGSKPKASGLSASELQDLRGQFGLNHERDQEIYDKVKALHTAGMPYEECLEVFADAYRKLDVVEEVEKGERGILVVFRGGAEVNFGLAFGDGSGINISSGQQVLIDRFWYVINSGGMVSFGFALGSKYRLYTPAIRVDKTRSLLNRLAYGEEVDPNDLKDTPLSNRAFRRDMLGTMRTKNPEETR